MTGAITYMSWRRRHCTASRTLDFGTRDALNQRARFRGGRRPYGNAASRDDTARIQTGAARVVFLVLDALGQSPFAMALVGDVWVARASGTTVIT
jgi:hypothetical protein